MPVLEPPKHMVNPTIAKSNPKTPIQLTNSISKSPALNQIQKRLQQSTIWRENAPKKLGPSPKAGSRPKECANS